MKWLNLIRTPFYIYLNTSGINHTIPLHIFKISSNTYVLINAKHQLHAFLWPRGNIFSVNYTHAHTPKKKKSKTIVLIIYLACLFWTIHGVRGNYGVRGNSQTCILEVKHPMQSVFLPDLSPLFLILCGNTQLDHLMESSTRKWKQGANSICRTNSSCSLWPSKEF